MKKHIYAISIILLTFILTINIVNGKSISKYQSETETVDVFFLDFKIPDDSIEYFLLLDSLSTKALSNGDKELLLETEIIKGRYYFNIDRFDSALTILENVKLLSHTKYDRIYSKSLKLVGLIYLEKADYQLAISHFYKALEIFERDSMLADQAKTLDALGSIYGNLNKYNNAKDYYLKSLSIKEKIFDSSEIASTYMNLGNIEAKEKSFNEALNYYSKSKEILTLLNQSEKIPVLLVNMGNIAYEINKYDSAIFYYKQSLDYFKVFGKDYYSAIIHQNIANTYFNLGKIDSSNYHFDHAIFYADKVEAKGLLKTIYGSLAFNSSQLKDYRKSSEYYKKHSELSEEIFNEELDNKLAEWQVKLETSEKEKEIALLKKNEELNKAEFKQRTTERNGLMIVTVLFFLLASTLFFAFRSKQKTNIELNVQKTEIQKNHAEKALLLKELHHRVKNNLQIVSSLLSLQSFQVKDDQTREAIVQGRNRVEAMSLIHQKLYQTDQITEIDLREYVENLTLNTMYSFGFSEQDVEFQINSGEMMVNVDKAIPLGLIINELVTNSFKHAFKQVENPKLDITLHRYAAEQLSIKIKDNGSGLPNGFEFEKKGSFGMELIQSLCRQIRAEIQLHEGPGCYVELKTKA